MSNSESENIEIQEVKEEQPSKDNYEKIIVDFQNPENCTKLPAQEPEKKTRRAKAKAQPSDQPIEEKKKRSPRKKKEEEIQPAPPPPPQAVEEKKKRSPRKKKEDAQQSVPADEKHKRLPQKKEESDEDMPPPEQKPIRTDLSYHVDILKQHQAANNQRKLSKYKSLISQAIN